MLDAVTRLRSHDLQHDVAYQSRIVRSLYGRWLDLHEETANPWRRLYDADTAAAIKQAVMDEIDERASFLLGIYGPDFTAWRRDITRWGVNPKEMEIT